MTERTIRSLAKEFAGIFYEQANKGLFGDAPEDRERSARFRQTYPTLKHYISGVQVLPDGRTRQDVPGWYYFVDAARKRMVQMLGDPMHKHLHDAIYKALIEEHNNSTSPRAQSILQRRMGDGIAFG